MMIFLESLQIYPTCLFEDTSITLLPKEANVQDSKSVPCSEANNLDKNSMLDDLEERKKQRTF